MDKIKIWILNILLKRYALGYLVTVWEFCTGYRTQIQTFIAVLVLANGVVGNMELETSVTIATALGGSTVATLLEKLKKHKDLVLHVQKAVDRERARNTGTTLG